ncbi:hypothetical protein GYMLUDRAFT_33653 [Collybiopsis luxurians FD-317 M1]|nr:hypothetical protein GYMLUDRAFT_33653 [Collybiopsis luxurians FD-317 M1]
MEHTSRDMVESNGANQSPGAFVPPVLQVPTPPLDDPQQAGYPSDNNGEVSISTTFTPHADWHTVAPDRVLSTSDSVLFYVHSHILLAASSNRFRSLIPEHMQASNSPIDVPEVSDLLNIVLHLIYDMPSARYSPAFQTLADAVDRLPLYGVSAKTHVASSTSLHRLLLSFAPLMPMGVYTLAAKHDLLELATLTSSHLLSFDLSMLTDEIANDIGPVYLRKLLFLHLGRSDALKKLLVQSPRPHGPTSRCGFDEQRPVTRAWALASAYVAWNARPDLSIGFLESTLNPLADDQDCELCKDSIKKHVRNLVVQWSQVKRTI